MLKRLIHVVQLVVASYLNSFNWSRLRSPFRKQEPPRSLEPEKVPEAAPTCCPAAMEEMLVALYALMRKCDPSLLAQRVALYVIRPI